MKEQLLELLACPECAGAIRLAETSEREDDEIMEGRLSCENCKVSYPILRGIPRFAELNEVEKDKAETAKSFGWQWQEFTQEDSGYKEQFLGWIQPVRQEFFEGKVVLEGGCGKGRHTVLAQEWGAKEVVGIDLSAAVETAFEATRELPNAHIVQADIFNLPFKRSFDYAFSVGVLHHTPDPKKAFGSLASKVAEGGHLSAWVYGRENNEWIVRLVNPIRERFTSKMSPAALYHVSKIPTVGTYLTSKLIYKPLNKVAPKLSKRLFYNEYLKQLGDFGWREQHNIVFDHLIAPTSHYISRVEFESWWEELNADGVTITWHNQNSWSGFGRL